MASTPTPPAAVTAKASRKPLRGVIEAANRNGVKIDGAWYDYGKVFKGEPLPKEAKGLEVELQLVESKADKAKKHGDSTWFIEVVLAPPAPPAPAPAAAGAPSSAPSESAQADILPEAASAAAPPSEAATAGQLKYAQDLGRKLQLSDEDMDTLSRLRFQGRALAQLSKDEMRLMIPFLGGHGLSS